MILEQSLTLSYWRTEKAMDIRFKQSKNRIRPINKCTSVIQGTGEAARPGRRARASLTRSGPQALAGTCGDIINCGRPTARDDARPRPTAADGDGPIYAVEFFSEEAPLIFI
ncbi:hypothetical protein EVAR_17996_1 [Eumeta japonica]|uniref:Uncharacterized protein n=1 Tax=Eumeta variegata TaxID=151549 RepID=A0A4C1Y775_EUMVA|nr:hypothetical protein EVAR_17996_1 [Eumeta japonica]